MLTKVSRNTVRKFSIETSECNLCVIEGNRYSSFVIFYIQFLELDDRSLIECMSIFDVLYEEGYELPVWKARPSL